MARRRRQVAEQMKTVARLERTPTALEVAEGFLRLRKTHKVRKRPPFGCIALVLQGGGALGAYQAGAYEALAEAGLYPDWIAGISIGAINSAIIAGNPRETRVAKLREFWEIVSRSPFGIDGNFGEEFARGDDARAFANRMSAVGATIRGVPGFYKARTPLPWFEPAGTLEATSYYDTTELKGTLERLIDFDRINSDENDTRLSLGSANVRTGNMVYFDTTTDIFRPEHVMASSALPPAFPAVEIDGERYWDGGLVSNTPLQWIFENRVTDTLAFQVDLWNPQGEYPRDLAEVFTRLKEIANSSRTQVLTGLLTYLNRVNYSIAVMLDKLPADLRDCDEAKFLKTIAARHVHNIVHLVYRPNRYESESKDHEFSRQSMEERWRAGYLDTVRTLRHPEVLERPAGLQAGIMSYDFGSGGRI